MARDPEDHDYAAAADYLSLIGEGDAVAATVDALKSAPTEMRKAKDVLRAARLALLPATNLRVKSDLAKIEAERSFRRSCWCGESARRRRLQIADGYHRVCASYLTDENTPIPCRLVSWQTSG